MLTLIITTLAASDEFDARKRGTVILLTAVIGCGFVYWLWARGK